MTTYRPTITPYFSPTPPLIALRLCMPSIVAIPASLSPSQAHVVAARPPKALKTASIPLSFAMAVSSVVRSVISILGVLCGHARLTRAPPNHALFDKRRAGEGVGNSSPDLITRAQGGQEQNSAVSGGVEHRRERAEAGDRRSSVRPGSSEVSSDGRDCSQVASTEVLYSRARGRLLAGFGSSWLPWILEMSPIKAAA